MSGWEQRMQQAAEDHITAVWDYANEADASLTDEELEDLGPDPAIGPWCGCTTCEVREILTVAIPIMAAAIVAGEVDPADLV